MFSLATGIVLVTVPHRDVDAMDSHGPHPGDEGSFHDGVGHTWSTKHC